MSSNFVVYITEYCQQQARNHTQLHEIERLQSKLETQAVIPNWDTVKDPHIRKKNLGKSYRLIAHQRNLPDIEQTIVCFLNILPRSSDAYEGEFLINPQSYIQRLMPSDDELRRAYHERFPEGQATSVPTASNKEYEYIYGKIGLMDESYGLVFESPDWVEKMKNPAEEYSRYYDLLRENIIEDDDETCTVIHCERSRASILYRRVGNHVYLIAPVDHDPHVEKTYRESYQDILSASSEQLTVEVMRRNSHRSYPVLVFALETRDWRAIEENSTGNLALSPEEAEILESVRHANESDRAYPLFINGRPGSGKSTILQYLFAEHLYQHLKRGRANALERPPIYLTYSSKLLEHARKSVQAIIVSNSHMLTDGGVNFDDSWVTHHFRRSFREFHRFLISMLPKSERARFPSDLQVEFPRFRLLWLEKRKSLPDHRLRILSPELVWHVLRTYIKGMRDEFNHYLDPDAYAEIPSGQKTVQQPMYELIFAQVWENWYLGECEREGYWDTQDLTRTVLNTEVDLSRFPVVFCDEAQDFTQIELELILRLSLFSSRRLESSELKMVPFAFAGDPFQTLNPTGFNWESVQADFHKRIVEELDRYSRANLAFNYRELTHNYRSTGNVIKFCNLLQLLRGVLFDIKNLKPQRVWFDDPNAAMPIYYNLDDPSTRKQLQDQAELVIIIPCQEGEEEEYVASDPVLQVFASTEDGLLRNFLSPMTAKGLEFSRVVLYKFGEACVADYPSLFDPLTSGVAHHSNHEASLPLQYFMNRLYVAASRARKRLIIVDTPNGIEGFWTRKDVNNFQNLVQRYHQDWEVDDLAFATPGESDSWAQDRDNPQQLAQALHEDGEADRDPYKLKLAAANYRRAKMERQAMRCDALRAEFQENFQRAGELYLELNDREQGLRCLWQARSYQAIMDGPFSFEPEQRAAYFMLEEKTPLAVQRFLGALEGFVIDERYQEQITDDSVWLDVCNRMVTELARIHEHEANWRSVFDKLSRMYKAGLIFDRTSDFALIAYHAGEFDVAVKIWNVMDRTTYDQELFYRAQAQVAHYPENIRWLWNTQQYDTLIEQWEKHPHEDIPVSDRNMVVNAYFNTENYRGAALFLHRHPEERLLLDLLTIVLEKQPRLAYRVGAILMDSYLREEQPGGAQWRKAISLVTDQRFPEDVQANLKLRLINECASQVVQTASLDEKTTINDFLKHTRKTDHGLVSRAGILIMGAAIEQAGKHIDALEFYEDIWRTNTIQADRYASAFAKRRWLKVKERQAEYNRSIKKDNEAKRQESDIQRKNALWHVDLEREPDYPKVDEESKALEAFLAEILSADEVDIETDVEPVPTLDVQLGLLNETTRMMIVTLYNSGFTAEQIGEQMTVNTDVVRAVLSESDAE